MEDKQKKKNITVQGHGTPVPASKGGEQAGPQASLSYDRSAAVVEHLASEASTKTSDRKENLFERLGKNINDLLEYVKDRHNVHGQIKRLASSIRRDYDLLAAVEVLGSPVRLQGASDIVKKTKSTQTQQSKVQFSLDTDVSILKKKSTTLPPSGNHLTDQNKEHVSVKKPYSEIISVPLLTGSGVSHSEPEWRTAEGRKYRHRHPRHIRPHALMIKQTAELTYADVLRRIKSDPDLKELSTNVTKIRRTNTGNLLLELGRSPSLPVTKFQESVANVLGNAVEIKALTHEIQVELKDLDELITKEEICKALIQQLQTGYDLNVDSVRSIRQAYSGTKTAVVSLPADLAMKALALGKMRIGWIVCRVREKLNLLRCFKCLRYGHLARNCKGTIDRADLCLRCSQKGHVAKSCPNKPSCILCREDGDGMSYEHAVGSFKCPTYQKALQIIINRRK